MSNESKATTDMLGKIIIYSVSGFPKTGVPYADFDRIAEITGSNQDNPLDKKYGFPRRYIPKIDPDKEVFHAQNAWSQGTGDFPTRGADFDPGSDVREYYSQKFGVNPNFKVRVVRHKKQAGSDVIKRHLYLDVYTPTGDSDTEGAPDDLNSITKETKARATKAATKQLQSLPVVLMEFTILEQEVNGKTKQVAAQRFVPTENVDRDILPAIYRLIEQMKDKVARAKNNANDQHVRVGVRSWLKDNSCFAVRGSGGNYFLPNTERKVDENGAVLQYSSEEKVEGLIEYFSELADLCDPEGDLPEIMVLDCYKDKTGSVHTKHANKNLMTKAINSIDERMEAILEDVAPIVSGKSSGKIAKRKLKEANMEVLQLFRDLDTYRDSFEDQFTSLDGRIDLLNKRLKEARKLA